jgi:hypothetical protein
MLPARWLTIFGACLCLVTAEANSADSNSPEDERAQPPTFISAVQESIRLQEQIDEYRVRLIEIESLGGPYDTRLSEILQGLTNVLVEVRSFDEVDKLLARRQLIIRTNEGPASLSQLPVVEQAIANDIRRGDWEAVTERYEFIFWLRSQNIDTNPVAQFEARNDLIDWHLTAVYLDRPNRRVRHLMQARLLDRQNLGDTQDHYG